MSTRRSAPYDGYPFRVKWKGRYAAGVSNVSALKHTTEVVEHRSAEEAALTRALTGGNKYAAITLERGITQDLEFDRWARGLRDYGSGAGSEVSLEDLRMDMMLDVFNEAGQRILAYKLHRCWVSEYRTLPELDANANVIAIETLKLENDGYERDYDVAKSE